MFRTTLGRRLAQATKPRLSAVNDMVAQERPSAFAATSHQPTYKYKLKKVWPPDIKNMTPQQQLRFEKKYKRRLKLATARPRWDKFVRLAQLFTTTCETPCPALSDSRVYVGLYWLMPAPVIAGYVVLGMSWDDVPNPFEPVSLTLLSLRRLIPECL